MAILDAAEKILVAEGPGGIRLAGGCGRSRCLSSNGPSPLRKPRGAPRSGRRPRAGVPPRWTARRGEDISGGARSVDDAPRRGLRHHGERRTRARLLVARAFRIHERRRATPRAIPRRSRSRDAPRASRREDRKDGEDKRSALRRHLLHGPPSRAGAPRDVRHRRSPRARRCGRRVVQPATLPRLAREDDSRSHRGRVTSVLSPRQSVTRSVPHVGREP